MNKFKVGDRVSLFNMKGKIIRYHEWQSIPNFEWHFECDVEYDDGTLCGFNTVLYSIKELKKLRPKKPEFKVGDMVAITWITGQKDKGDVRRIDGKWIDVFFEGVGLIYSCPSNSTALTKLKKAKTMLRVGDRVRVKSLNGERLSNPKTGKVVSIEGDRVSVNCEDSSDQYFCNLSKSDLVRLIKPKKKYQKDHEFNLPCGCEECSSGLKEYARVDLQELIDAVVKHKAIQEPLQIQEKLRQTLIENEHLKSCIRKCVENKEKLIEQRENIYRNRTSNAFSVISLEIQNKRLQKENEELKKEIECLKRYNKRIEIGYDDISRENSKLKNESEQFSKSYGLLNSENEQSKRHVNELKSIIDIGKSENRQLRCDLSSCTERNYELIKQINSKPTLDLTKPVQTMSGVKVKIIDRIMVEFKGELGYDSKTYDYRLNGTFIDLSGKRHPENDLINVPEEK